ncbi:NAD(P)-dependent oxidoreductase [Actinoallomurus spadix]|uniref:NAD(P)-dependent oxidoreductase n=1 Tax=Actinoallomurus spadix TaxID=79912 RepID=A0ABN0WNR6_9ACTN|nr:NAD(P)-dependent oxidoreductase [Actinoallomurus spadix]MCO5984695.1 NAD(P)-dependent oxidoreductase [Actinoallomurus spadix]
MTVALLGTGIMGAAMARNLLAQGIDLRAWNRTRAKAEAVGGLKVAGTPAEAVEGATVIITMLNDGEAVLRAMEQAAPGLREGQIWAQMSTVGLGPLDDLRALAERHGLVFVDAPVQGSRQPAERGELIVLASGPERAREPLEPVFDAVGKQTLWLGPAGTGSRLKLVTNTWALTLVSGVGEALALARALDVDPRAFRDVVGAGPMDSALFQQKAAAIMAGDFAPTFTVTNAEKDTRLICAAAASAGVRMDVMEATRERFRRAGRAGHAEEDMAAAYFAGFTS